MVIEYFMFFTRQINYLKGTSRRFEAEYFTQNNQRFELLRLSASKSLIGLGQPKFV